MPMLPGCGIIDLGRAPEEHEIVIERVRVFTGYAGWGAGQVEDEIAANAWFVLESDRGDAFTDDPASLWKRVLQRQRSDLKMYALFPENPRQN